MKAPSVIIALIFAFVIGYLYGKPHQNTEQPCMARVVLSVDFKAETLEDLNRMQWAETQFCYANPGKTFDDSGIWGKCTPLSPGHGFVDTTGQGLIDRTR
jgi:hypothetical protein